jgi:hypothetical protein
MKILYNPNLQEVYEGYTQAVEDLSYNIYTHYFVFEDVVKEIEDMRVKLLRAPEDDMASFNTLYAEAQSYHSRACGVLISFIDERRFWRRLEIIGDKLYARSRNFLLGTPEIQDLRNQALQNAKVDSKLQLLLSLISVITGALSDMKDLIEIVQVKIDELNNIITNMSRQQRVTESLIGLGYPVRGRK